MSERGSVWNRAGCFIITKMNIIVLMTDAEYGFIIPNMILLIVNLCAIRQISSSSFFKLRKKRK